MGIRAKIILVVLPLIIVPLLLTGIIASLSARNGITGVATEFLQFKSEELINYAEGQWALLRSNGLEDNTSFVEAAKSAVQSFARNLVRTPTELIFAIDRQGTVAMSSAELELTAEERSALSRLAAEETGGWRPLRLGGIERVAHVDSFPPFGWITFVTEERSTFYQTTNQIAQQTALILGVSLAAAVALLLMLAAYLTRPLRNVVQAMTDIIGTSDLSRRVEVLYRDETGRLGHTFNLMTSELQKAYDHIKGYALKAVVAKMREQKIRNIFQKYVPKAVIDQFYSNPEAMLVGENRVLAVLFSDIRRFTTLSEQLRPDEIVQSLNDYFALMVDVIMNRGGIVDKYIGDAIMAFFGAPVRHQDDARQSVLAGLEMLEGLRDFNRFQLQKRRPEFRIGIGINYGAVTVGNIGSEKKMDYTVIGDMVNVASRLEGLTKRYLEPIIVSESVYRKIESELPCRQLDRVVVKGRSVGVGVYAVRRRLSTTEARAWELHRQALDLYYRREFAAAAERFAQERELLPEDHCSVLFIERCRNLIKNPPGPEWAGLEALVEK